jgi:Putative exonuclease SbcCD, C subunit/P-loop containing region of AAA domain
MTRTIRLTRLHALNWYGYKDTLPINGNALLAGVTGSGKSALMDLIQLVLVGDQRLVRFNQSATGDRGSRTVKGYCLGDTKQEDGGVPLYMRPSTITYVALEFTWPNNQRAETWGLRIEFVSAAETQGKVTPFFAPSSLARSDFLDQEKRPLDYTAFKAFVEVRNGRLYTEGLEAYLRDMAQPNHLNYDRAILRSLLPTAMSFTFLRSFNDFARQFILPADKLDVADVTASYRTFQGYERDLQALDDQFRRLRNIHDTFNRLNELRRDGALARYLEAQLRHEHVAERLAEDEEKLNQLREANAEEEKRLQQLDEQIPALQRQIDGIKSAIRETPGGSLYLELKANNEKLSRKISQLSGIGTTLQQALANRVRNARQWLKEFRTLPLDIEDASADAVERCISEVESEDIGKAAETLGKLARAAQAAATAAGRSAKPQIDRLLDIRHQLGQLRDEIAALRLGRLPGGHSRLLDALNNSLLSPGKGLPAQPLCRLCEVTDERWRPAIEIAFARKFAIVVDAQNYEQAEKIYHRLKASDIGDGGRESLINPQKALKLKRRVQPGSLAEKLHATHPVAEALISLLFGDLMCVEQLEQLRDHDQAILPDGFMTRGAFVERRRFYDGNPFVGENGLKQQLAWKEKQRDSLEIEERQLEPIERAIKSVSEACQEHFAVPHDLYQDIARAQELPKLRSDLQENLDKLQKIDRALFDDFARQQSSHETALAGMEIESRALLQSEKRGQLGALENQLKARTQEVKVLHQKFTETRNSHDVSMWTKRLDRLRECMVAKFSAKDVSANRFNHLLHRLDKRATEVWERLKARRRELGVIHSKFDDLPVEAEDNADYEKQLGKLGDYISEYKTKAERERKNWEGLFRTQVLEKLTAALQSIKDLLYVLNLELKKHVIGNDHYHLHYWQNPEFKIYHDLLAKSWSKEGDLWFASLEPAYRDAVQNFLNMLIEDPDAATTLRFLDYRHYYEYDMEVVGQDGRKTSVDRQSSKFSGGENQSPYFVAILASYLRAYRRYSTRRQEPSLGLVPIDEAFSKLSGERIADCIAALKAFDLQGILSMSTGNIPYALEHCDWLVAVSKEERRNGKRLQIRNIPVCIAHDSEEALRLVNK